MPLRPNRSRARQRLPPCRHSFAAAVALLWASSRSSRAGNRSEHPHDGDAPVVRSRVQVAFVGFWMPSAESGLLRLACGSAAFLARLACNYGENCAFRQDGQQTLPSAVSQHGCARDSRVLAHPGCDRILPSTARRYRRYAATTSGDHVIQNMRTPPAPGMAFSKPRLKFRFTKRGRLARRRYS